MGGFTVMWKFGSLEKTHRWETRFTTIKEAAVLRSEFLILIVPESYSQVIWESVRCINRQT
jgi:hypothetical protein